METRKTVLVCPLNWGLGHASRCVPLIETLQAHGFHVVLASSGRAGAFLQQRFTTLPYVEFPDYDVHIPRSGKLIRHLILNLPFYLYRLSKEHHRLKSILSKYKVDIVVSDNRYGLSTRRAHTVFITHQLMLKCPPTLRFMEGWVHRVILRFVRKFDECWIPEGEENLAGDLSVNYPFPANAHRVGQMSRFSGQEIPGSAPAYELLGVISGPEPQRSHFEKILLAHMQESGKRCCILQGLPGLNTTSSSGNISLIAHADDPLFSALVHNAQMIICRPGYSTLMDLLALGKGALLIPTPGQTEQEYLALRMSEAAGFNTVTQATFETSGFSQIPGRLDSGAGKSIKATSFKIPATSPLNQRQD